MKNILGILAALVTLLLASCSQTPTPTQDLESLYINTALYDTAKDASATASGVYVIGDSSDVGFNNGATDNVLLQKFGFSGNLLWSKNIKTSGLDSAAGIAIGANTVYVLGETSGSLAGSVGGEDSFLRAYNESGAVLWTKQFGTSSPDFAVKVRTNSAGHAIVLSLEGGITVRKVTPAGAVSQLIRNTGYGASDFTLDNNGNIFILGTQYINGGLKAFILKYNSVGTLLSTTFVDWFIHDIWNTSPAITSNGIDIFVSYRAFSGGAWIRKYPNVLTSATLPSKKVNLPNTEIASMKVAGGFLYAVGVNSASALAKKYDGNLNQVWSKQLVAANGGGKIFLGLATRPDAIYPVGYASDSSNTDGTIARLNTTNGSTVWSQ